MRAKEFVVEFPIGRVVKLLKNPSKVKDLAYDLVNRPDPYNPLTAKDIGTDKGSAKYHAERLFQKQTGRDAPALDKSSVANDNFVQDKNKIYVPQSLPMMKQRAQDQIRLSDIESDLIKRGYGSDVKVPEIGSGIGQIRAPRKINPSQSYDMAQYQTGKDLIKAGGVDALLRSGELNSQPEKKEAK